MTHLTDAENFIDVFTNFGGFPLNTDTFDVLEEFSCHLYGHIKQNGVHEAIILHFEENCIERHLGNIKSVEPRMLKSLAG